MKADDVTVCIPTRGDLDLKPILDSLIFPNVVIWNNRERENLRTYGRYAAIAEAETPVVFTMDDDSRLTPDQQQQILDAYSLYRGDFIVANQSPGHHTHVYEDLTFLGWGAIFAQELPELVLGPFLDEHLGDEGFLMVGCDILFSMLNPVVRIDVGQENIPEAFGSDRTYRQPAYSGWKQRYYDLAKELQSAPA